MAQGVISHSDQSLHQSLHSNYNFQVMFIDYYCLFKIFFLNLNIFCAWKLRSTPKNPSSLRIGRLLLLSWWCRESPFILSLCHRVVSALLLFPLFQWYHVMKKPLRFFLYPCIVIILGRPIFQKCWSTKKYHERTKAIIEYPLQIAIWKSR